MNSIWLFRLSVLVAACVLFQIATGSAVTGNLLEPLASPPGGIFSEAGHMGFAAVTGLLTLATALWMIAAGGSLRTTGLVTALLLLAEGGLGTPSLQEKFTPGLPILHACLAHLLFAATVASVILASPGRTKDTVVDAGWPSLRSLAMVTPVLTFVQVLLGAAFRHKAIGIMPHIAGAILIALLILLTGMFVTQQCPQHRSLKPAAVTLMTAVFVQVFLGIGALTMRMINSTDTPAVILVTGAHVVAGAFTLASNLALSVQIRYHVVPKLQPVEA
jgi:hypothetical protein